MSTSSFKLRTVVLPGPLSDKNVLLATATSRQQPDALLHIMAHGEWEGHGVGDPRVRAMFTRESVLASDWYQERLRAKQERDMALWSRHIAALEAFVAGPGSAQFDVRSLIAEARAQMARVGSVAYLAELVGTIGADPFTDGV